MEHENSQKCAVMVHMYDKSDYVLFDKNSVGDWAYFLRTCKYKFY